jgi:putative Holliday junction resolvase
MALDVGKARIGVAVCDASGTLASPYTTLHVTRDEAQTWTAIRRLIAETEAQGLVIGLPVSLDGQLHTQAEQIQTFAERLKTHISIPLTFWDERFSTVEAQRLLTQRAEDEGRVRRDRHQRHQARRCRGMQELDALAATVILEDYLEHLRRKGEEKR